MLNIPVTPWQRDPGTFAAAYASDLGGGKAPVGDTLSERLRNTLMEAN